MEPVLKTNKVWLAGMVKIKAQISEMPNPFWPDSTSLLWCFLTKTAIILSMLNYTMLGKLTPATDKLDEFLPGPYLNHSVIKVRDFKSPQLLADYIKHLSNNEAEYNKYLEWKWKGYGDITGTAIGN